MQTTSRLQILEVLVLPNKPLFLVLLDWLPFRIYSPMKIGLKLDFFEKYAVSHGYIS